MHVEESWSILHCCSQNRNCKWEPNFNEIVTRVCERFVYMWVKTIATLFCLLEPTFCLINSSFVAIWAFLAGPNNLKGTFLFGFGGTLWKFRVSVDKKFSHNLRLNEVEPIRKREKIVTQIPRCVLQVMFEFHTQRFQVKFDQESRPLRVIDVSSQDFLIFQIIAFSPTQPKKTDWCA